MDAGRLARLAEAVSRARGSCMKKAAKDKLEYNQNREWAGYLTPSDLRELTKDHTIKIKKRDLEWMQTNLKAGRSNPRWIYVIISKG